jgi:hypothetical protein
MNAKDAIYVGVCDHSAPSTNDMRLYWNSGRGARVKDAIFESGLTTSADLQRKIIEELEQDQVKWLVIEERQEVDEQLGHQAIPTPSTELDVYIREHYVVMKGFGPYYVLRWDAER